MQERGKLIVNVQADLFRAEVFGERGKLCSFVGVCIVSITNLVIDDC